MHWCFDMLCYPFAEWINRTSSRIASIDIIFFQQTAIVCTYLCGLIVHAPMPVDLYNWGLKRIGTMTFTLYIAQNRNVYFYSYLKWIYYPAHYFGNSRSNFKNKLNLGIPDAAALCMLHNNGCILEIYV